MQTVCKMQMGVKVQDSRQAQGQVRQNGQAQQSTRKLVNRSKKKGGSRETKYW